MKPEDVLLLGAALLAALFFTGGAIEVFGVPVSRKRRRRRKPVRRRRKPDDEPSAPKPLTTPNPVIGSSSPPMTPKVAWPARPPTVAPVLRQATSVDPHSDVEEPSPDQLERGKMVVRYVDGRIIKGYSHDFYADKPHFHLVPSVAGFSFSDEATEVRVQDLKAVFFVRDFAGDPSYNERKKFAEGERPPGRKVEVTFKDGEVLVGSTVGYDRTRPVFFFIPADPKSNNQRVFVVCAAVTKVRFL
ncbi:MAG: hypothetical protein AAB016_01015 [candidate division NC10 bacterium]